MDKNPRSLSMLKNTPSFHNLILLLLTGDFLNLFNPNTLGITETDRFMGSYPAIPFELWGNNQPETVVVIAVVGIVVVAIRHAAVPGVVVPAAAAQNTVAAL